MADLDAVAGLAVREPPESGGTARGERSGSFERTLAAVQRPADGGTSERVVEVRRGDSVWALARRHGTSVAAIARANDLADPSRIHPGDRLRIPEIPKSAAPERVPSLPPVAAAPPPSVPVEGVEVRVHTHVVRPGDNLWKLAVETFKVDPEALARQNGIEDPGALQPGQVLRIERRIDGRPREVLASWYGPGFDGRPMANGQPYDRHAATIAHKQLPLGSEVELTNPQNGRSVRAVVTDRGPYVPGREVDLSYGLARKLGLLEAGVGRLIMRERG